MLKLVSEEKGLTSVTRAIVTMFLMCDSCYCNDVLDVRRKVL